MTWAQQVVRDIEDWRLGRLDFAAIERCAVVAGPPGVGKTQLARSLARTASLPLVATSVAGWFSGSAGYLDSASGSQASAQT